MILGTSKIYQLLHDATVPVEDRLVITPVLDFDTQTKAGNCSIDIRLGQTFQTPRRTKLDRLDHLSTTHAVDFDRYKDVQQVLLGDYFVLHPRQFVLGESLEWIHLPKNLAAYVIGRSAWGRDGLVIATATGVHPNFSGVLTLEITNLGELPLRLYPGLTIAQLFIHTVDFDPSGKVVYSRFSGATTPESANAAGSDIEMIRRLARQHGYDLS